MIEGFKNSHGVRTGTVSVRLIGEETSAKLPVVPASLSKAESYHLIIKVQQSGIQYRCIINNKNVTVANDIKKGYQGVHHKCEFFCTCCGNAIVTEVLPTRQYLRYIGTH